MLQNDYVLLLDELRLKLLDVKPQIDDLADAIGLNPLKEELSQLRGRQPRRGSGTTLPAPKDSAADQPDQG